MVSVFKQATVSEGMIVFQNATDKDCAELMSYLAAQMIPINRLERHEADLEDLFMEVISK